MTREFGLGLAFKKIKKDKWLNPRYPSLPINNTQEIISHIPEGNWEIPQEPFSTSPFRVDENSMDFIKEHHRELFQKDCRETIAEWIPFLDEAEEGYRMVRETIETRKSRADVKSIMAFDAFIVAFKAKKEPAKKDYQKLITSCRNALLKLLFPEEIDKLGHQKPERLNEKDIDNVKILVNNFPSNSIRPTPYP